ncbi:MAG: 16S rRNA (guanine(966)-N(2))-methyltransferase RsmD [Pseudomonadota bacterium]
MAQRIERNRFRIIGGRWRGKKLDFADRAGLRPTPGRVRETLFNWLAPTLHGARCLDAFAGTGSLGLEALSRGAGSVVFVEQDRVSASSVQAHLAAVGAESATVVHADTSAWLATATGPFDLVFADPPFGSDLLQRLCTLLQERALLAPGGRLYAEYDRRLGFEPAGWQPVRQKAAGQVGYGLFVPREA